MNRQAFFQTFSPKEDNQYLANLLPYTQPLTQPEVLHLLRRTTLAINWATVQSLVGKTASEIVELLLNNALKNPKPNPPAWINDGFKNPSYVPAENRQKLFDEIYKTLYDQNYELKRWWIEAMAVDTISIREKMTLFWHGHFTTKFAIDQIMPAQLMYRQNDLLRTLHQGNLRTLLESITLDGAMLIFLNGRDSTRKSPNENFSRELLELYTMGIGNYTEKDVQEGARILTGWKTNYYTDDYKDQGIFKTFFASYDHDISAKSYLGGTIKASVNNLGEEVLQDEVKGMIKLILDKRAEETSTFICEKLYRFFVYSNASQSNPEVVADLAKTLRDNNFEIRPVLARLLKSTFFFDKSNIGTQIKTPAELIVGITKHFDVKGDWKEWVMVTMGQELLNPPNVSGWAGYHKWADTRTFPFAIQQIGNFMYNQKDEYLLEWIKQFDDYITPRSLVKSISTLFLAKAMNDAQLDRYTKILLNNSPDYEWLSMLKVPATAGWRLKLFMIALSKDPNFHLT